MARIRLASSAPHGGQMFDAPTLDIRVKDLLHQAQVRFSLTGFMSIYFLMLASVISMTVMPVREPYHAQQTAASR